VKGTLGGYLGSCCRLILRDMVCGFLGRGVSLIEGVLARCPLEKGPSAARPLSADGDLQQICLQLMK
jgi:hypothetical protein